MKECYLIEFMEYAVLQNIDHEPDFNLWAKQVNMFI